MGPPQADRRESNLQSHPLLHQHCTHTTYVFYERMLLVDCPQSQAALEDELERLCQRCINEPEAYNDEVALLLLLSPFSLMHCCQNVYYDMHKFFHSTLVHTDEWKAQEQVLVVRLHGESQLGVKTREKRGARADREFSPYYAGSVQVQVPVAECKPPISNHRFSCEPERASGSGLLAYVIRNGRLRDVIPSLDER